jgi:hypothetical protein
LLLFRGFYVILFAAIYSRAFCKLTTPRRRESRPLSRELFFSVLLYENLIPDD